MIEEVHISKLVLHILDNTLGMPILSESEHPNDSDINDFIKSHIEKVFKDVNIKNASFENEGNEIRALCERVMIDDSNFLDVSKKLAEKLYAIIIKNVNIPSCDLVCSTFNGDGKSFLGMFILNYKTSYIHYVEESGNTRTNKMIKQITTLPNTSQSIEEFIIIDLSDYTILLKEKKHEIDGIKEHYLSRYFLNSHTILSDKEKVDIISKTSKKMINDYYDGDVKKMADLKTAIKESIEENDNIDIEHIKKKTFSDNLELQQIYSEELEAKGIKENNISINENVIKKIPKMQKLVTEDGIELKIPISYLNTEEKVEFINNSDGTISILLKNIRDIQDK